MRTKRSSSPFGWPAGPPAARAGGEVRASLILPTLNGSITEPISRLTTSLTFIAEGKFEILVVDDSPDEMRAALRHVVEGGSTNSRVHVRFIDGPRTGKGAAVRRGIESATGSVIFIIDCDLPVPLEHVAGFLKLVEDGADAVVAERPADRNAGRPLRHALSVGLQAVQRALVFHSSRFGDTQCGFKAFRADLLRQIATKQIVEGGMFDLEYLYVAARWGATIITVSVVTNEEVRESRINVLRRLRRDPLDVLRIKVRGLTRGYD